jgi:hypothetical protein
VLAQSFVGESGARWILDCVDLLDGLSGKGNGVLELSGVARSQRRFREEGRMVRSGDRLRVGNEIPDLEGLSEMRLGLRGG